MSFKMNMPSFECCTTIGNNIDNYNSRQIKVQQGFISRLLRKN